MTEEEWFAKLEQSNPGVVARLKALLATCAPSGITWAIEKVLVFRIKTASGVINPVGIQLDEKVFLPWRIGPYKSASMDFVATLEDAIPGSES